MLLNYPFNRQFVLLFLVSVLYFLAAPVMAYETTLFPQEIKKSKGSISDQPISVLSVKDQIGTADDWDNYIDFTPESSGLAVGLVFNVPELADIDQATLSLNINYNGWSAEKQAWDFQIYDHAQEKWTYLGNNEEAKNWEWSNLHFIIPGNLSSYLKNGKVEVRYGTESDFENSLIDYFSLVIASSEVIGGPSTNDCHITQVSEKYRLHEKGCLRGANMFQGEQYASVENVWNPVIKQADLSDLKAHNANYVNLSVPGPFNVVRPYRKNQKYFKKLDELIKMAEAADLFVVLSFRTGPGRGEGDITCWKEPVSEDCPGNIRQRELFKNKKAQAAFVRMWKKVASRYLGKKHVVGYDLLVEPHDVKSRRWRKIAQRTINSIRSVDQETPILISPISRSFPDDWGGVDSLSGWKPLAGDKLVYTVHQYQPYEFTHNINESAVWTNQELTKLYDSIDKWKNKYAKPIIVNEYGISIIDGDALLNKGADFMAAQTERLEKSQLGHAVWIWEVEYDPDYTFQAFDFKENPQIFNVIKQSWDKNIIFPSMMLDK
jgi:hypothetical protein